MVIERHLLKPHRNSQIFISDCIPRTPPYVRMVANAIFETHLPGIHALAKEKYNLPHLRGLVVKLDLTKFPHAMDVLKIDDIAPELEKRTSAELYTSYERALRRNYTLILCICPKRLLTPDSDESTWHPFTTCTEFKGVWIRAEPPSKRDITSGMRGPSCSSPEEKPVECYWDRIDQVIDRLPYQKSTEWLLEPPGTRLRKLIANVDAVVDTMAEEFLTDAYAHMFREPSGG